MIQYLIVFLALLITACGGQSDLRSTKYAQNYTFQSAEPSDQNTTSSNGTLNTSGSSGSTSKSTGKSPYSFRIGATGYVSTSVSVRAYKTLKVKFTPGVQDETITDTQNYAHYSGLGVFITVGSNTQATPLLYNGLYGGSPQNAVLDFSSALNSLSGTSSITIKISQPNTDYSCIHFGYGCPWSHVSDSHPWHGTLQVQTDDTDSL